METKEFRENGHRFIDWIADFMDGIEDYPVAAQVRPGDIKRAIPLKAPEKGEPMESIFTDFQRQILPGITHWQHPSWFAYFPANNSPPSVLGELLTAGLGAQGMIWQTSPAAAELEERVMEWLRDLIGLPETMTGVIQDTASTATLCALLSAREKATGFRSNEEGIARPMRVYVSSETHSSIEKGVKIAGYGRKNLRVVPSDDEFAMIPEELEKMITSDKDAGFIPACVVASVGTTSSTAVDPVREIGEICRRHGIWYHVDAAYAGTACVLPEMRWILDGMELADSFVFNPHKWMLTNFDCSAYYVKDKGHLVRTFEIHPEYLKTGVDALVNNYRDWGIQLGRRFRALKLWFVLRSYGGEGIRKMVKEHIRLAQLFRGWIEEDKRFEVLAPVHFGLVCFRYNDGSPEERLTELNAAIMKAVNDTGKLFMTHTVLKGRYTMRMVIGQRTTEERHVRQAWDLIRKMAGECGVIVNPRG